MNDYAHHQAQISGSLEGQGIISRLIENFHARRAVRQLLAMDDYMLRDMGVTRAEVNLAANASIFRNAAMALEDQSATRRRANLCRG